MTKVYRQMYLYGHALFAMARPMQLLAVTLVYGLGTLIALAQSATLNTHTLFIGYIALLLVSASIHYANEYADYETDRITKRTPFSGGSGALLRTGVPRYTALWAATIALLIGGSIGITGLVYGRFPPVTVVILLLGAVGGWMYSLPPLRLAWRGWGEIDNALLGGVLLPVYGFAVQSGQVSWQIVLICLPFGILVFINLLATTWADREADAQVGKYTLATRWPISHLRILYNVAAGAAFMLLISLPSSLLPPAVAWSGFIVVPVVIWGSFSYTRIHSPFPTVTAMVLYLLIQIGAWGIEIANIG